MKSSLKSSGLVSEWHTDDRATCQSSRKDISGACSVHTGLQQQFLIVLYWLEHSVFMVWAIETPLLGGLNLTYILIHVMAEWDFRLISKEQTNSHISGIFFSSAAFPIETTLLMLRRISSPDLVFLPPLKTSVMWLSRGASITPVSVCNRQETDSAAASAWFTFSAEQSLCARVHMYLQMLQHHKFWM